MNPGRLHPLNEYFISIDLVTDILAVWCILVLSRFSLVLGIWEDLKRFVDSSCFKTPLLGVTRDPLFLTQPN